MQSKLGRTIATILARRYGIVHLFLLIFFCWAVLNWDHTIRHIVRCYTPLPAGDYWRVPENLQRYRAFDFTVLWKQHNEHRIVVQEIVFAVDILFLHGRQILPLVASFLCYFMVWVVLGSVLWSDRAVPILARVAAILLAGSIIGYEGSAAALASPFLLQWPLVQLSSVVALVCVSKIASRAGGPLLVSTIAAAIVATYSSGNGLLLWPILIAAAFVCHIGRRYIAVLALAAVASDGLYFVGYHSSQTLNLHNLLSHPFYLLAFVGAYLSMPFGAIGSSLFSVWIGLFSLVTAIALTVRAAKYRLLGTTAGTVFVGSYVFTILTALITAAGRMNLADSTFGAAKASRYVTVPLVNWAVLVLLAVWVLSRSGRKAVAVPGLLAMAAILTFIGFSKLTIWLQTNDEMFSGWQLAALGIENGLSDPSIIRKVFPEPIFVLRLLPQLRRSDLSVFYKGHNRWLGEPLNRLGPVLSSPASGQVVNAYPIQSGFEVVGWVDQLSALRNPYSIVLYNNAGKIAGTGRRLPAGFPRELSSPHVPGSLAWVGFINSEFDTGSFTAFLRNKNGLSPLVGSFFVTSTAEADEAGHDLPAIAWQMDSTWRVNQLPPRISAGKAPTGTVYSSWSGSDSNTGRISSSAFEVPADRCIILPVLHGPSIGGLSIELSNADTRQVILTAPLRDGQLQWQYWRFSIAPGVKRVRITGRDLGQDWGEWVALAQPKACREH